MNELQIIALFLLVCIPIRLFIAYCAIMVQKDNKLKNLKYFLAGFCLVIGLSFIYQYFKGNMIGGFGGSVWWGNLRILQALNYLAYVIMSYNDISYAYFPLLIDVMIGLLGFTFHHVSLDRMNT